MTYGVAPAPFIVITLVTPSD